MSHDNGILAASVDDKIFLWHTQSGKLIRELDIKSENICNLAFSPDDKMLVAGYSNSSGNIATWKVKPKKKETSKK